MRVDHYDVLESVDLATLFSAAQDRVFLLLCVTRGANYVSLHGLWPGCSMLNCTFFLNLRLVRL